MTVYYHGGFPGLRPGDILTVAAVTQRRHVDGCAICAARNSAQSSILDPTPAHPGHLYITTDRDYARFYAGMARLGDLYVVEPIGDLTPSTEDRFPSWVVAEARVQVVYDRAVRMTDGQRRALIRRWTEADAAADGWLERYRAMSTADRRNLHAREWARLWHIARGIAAGAR